MIPDSVEKRKIVDNTYLLINQVKFEKLPQIILDEELLSKSIELPSDQELNEVIYELNKRCFSKEPKQKDLQEFYLLSKKVIEKFKACQKDRVVSYNISFLKSVLQSLNFQRVYLRDSEKISDIIYSCSSLNQAFKKVSGFLENYEVRDLRKELTILEEKLDFQKEYLKEEPHFLKIEDALALSLQKLEEQKLYLQSGEKLDYSPEPVLEVLKEIKELAQFCSRLDGVLLNKTAKLTYFQQAENHFKATYIKLQAFLDVYQKEYVCEMEKLYEMMSHDSLFDQDSFLELQDYRPALNFMSHLKSHEALATSYQKIEEALENLKENLKTHLIEPKSWLGSIQAWTATLYNLPSEILNALSHPLKFARAQYASQFEMTEGALQYQIQKFISLLDTFFKPKSSINLEKLYVNVENMKAFQTYLLSLSDEELAAHSLKRADLNEVLESSLILKTREVEERSSWQKAYLKKLDELNMPSSKMSRAKRVFIASIGLFALAQGARYGLSFFQSAKANDYAEVVKSQIDPSILSAIDVEAGRLETYLKIHGANSANLSYIEPEAFKKMPELSDFLRNLYAQNRLNLLDHISETVEEFKSIRILQEAPSFFPSLKQMIKKAKLQYHFMQKKGYEISQALEVQINFPSFIQSMLWDIKENFSFFVSRARKMTHRLDQEVIEYSKFHHLIGEKERQLFQSKVEAIYKTIAGSSYLGLSQKETNEIEKHFSEISALYETFSQRAHKFPDQNHVSKLLEKKDATISQRLLAHIVGDPIAKESGLEGYNFEAMIKDFTHFLEIQKELKQPFFPAESLLQTLKRSLSFHKDFFKKENAFFKSQNDKNFETPLFSEDEKMRLNVLRDHFKSHLDALKIGEPLIILGGWVGAAPPGAGHGISYEIYKEVAGQFRIRLSNRGAGLQYHPKYEDNGKVKIVPFIEKTHIPIEDLLEPTFVAALYEMGSLSFDTESQMPGYRSWGENHIYQALISDTVLRGHFELNAKDSDWVEPQLSGTCAYQSLAQSLRNLMTKEQFDRFEIEFGIWALESAFSKQVQIENKFEQLLSKSLYAYASSLSQKIEENYKIFEPRELKLISECLMNMQTLLKKRELAQKTKIQSLSHSLVSAQNAEKVSVPVFNSPEIKEALSSFKIVPYGSGFSIDHMSVYDIVSSFEDIQKHLDALKKNHQHLYGLIFLDQLTAKIHQHDYSIYSAQQKEAIVQDLVNLTDEIFLFLNNVDNGLRILPKSYLSTLRISDILYQIVDQEMAEKFGFEYPLNFLFMGIDKVKMPHFTTADPKLDQELLFFYEKRKNILDKIPILFPKRGHEYAIDSLDPLDAKSDLAKVDGDFFFSQVLLPSFSKMILKKEGSYHDLWLKVGNALQQNENKRLQFPSMSKTWNLLIHQGIKMNMLSESYLDQISRNPNYREDKRAQDILFSCYPIIDKEGEIKKYFPSLDSHIISNGGVSKYPHSNKQRVRQDTYWWINPGGHLFEQNHPEIKNELLDFVIKYWQAHLFRNGHQRFQLKKEDLYKGSFEDDLFNIAGLSSKEKVKPLKFEVPSYFSADEVLDHLLIIEEPALRISRAISFFSNPVYSEKILQKDYQTFFYLLLFGDQELFKQITQKEDKEALAKMLTHFLKNQFHKQVIAHEIPTSMFLLKLNRKLQDYFCFADPTLCETSLFLNSDKEIEQLLQNPQLQLKDAYYLHRERVATLSSKREVNSKEDLENLLVSYISYAANQNMAENAHEYEMRQDIELGQEIYENMYHLGPKIKEELSKDVSKTLNNVMKKLGYPISENDRWAISRSGYPYYSCDEKEISLNIQEGRLHFENKGEALLKLPYEIISSSDYLRLFGKKSFSVIDNGQGIYQFVDDLGDSYRIKVEKNGSKISSFHFEKLVEGHFCSYVPTERLMNERIGNLNFIKEYAHWKNDSQNLLYFYKIDTGKLILKDYGYERLVKVNTKEELIDPKSTLFSFITRFENEKFINVFKGNEKITQVEFPRQIMSDGKILSFYESNNRLKCSNYPHLYLSSQDYFFKNQYNALVLEDEFKNPSKVLMTPYLYSESNKKTKLLIKEGGLNTHQPVSQEEDKIGKKYDVIEYNVIQNPEKKYDDNVNSYSLVSQSTKESLYLAYTYLRAHEYENAAKELQSLRSTFAALSLDELEILSTIIEMEEYNSDHDPRALSLQMLASYIFLDNQARFDTDLSKNFLQDMHEKITNKYHRYLAVRSFVNLYELNFYHEFQILDYVQKSPLTLSRKEELMKKVNIEDTSLLVFKPSIIYLPNFGSKRISFFNLLNSFEKLFFGMDREKLPNEMPSLDWNSLVKETKPSFPLYTHLEKTNQMSNNDLSLLAPSADGFLYQFIALYEYAKNYQNLVSSNESYFDLFKQLEFLKVYQHGFGDDISDETAKLIQGLYDLLYLVAEYPNLFPEVSKLKEYVRYRDLVKEKTLNQNPDRAFIEFPDAYPLTFQLGKSTLNAMAVDAVNFIIKSFVDNGFYSFFENIQEIQKRPQVKRPGEKVQPKPKEALVFKDFQIKNYILNSENEMVEAFGRALIKKPERPKSYQEKVEESLKPFFEKKRDENFQKIALKNIKEDCSIFLQIPNKVKYQLKESDSISSLIEVCENQMKESQKRLKELQSKILALANKPKATKEEAIKEIRIASESQKLLNLDDLFLIFISQDPSSYYKANTALSEDEVHLLNENVMHYLVESTYLQKLKRIEYTMQKVDGSNGPDRQEWEQRLGELIYAKREYEIKRSPAYLVFEHYKEILLYKNQVEKLQELEVAAKEKRDSKELGLIIEAIMGFGKSKVMLPLLSLHLADQNALPILVMPDSLIESLGQDIKQTLNPFNQKLKVIEFTRSTDCSFEKLDHLHNLLKAAIENKEAIIFSSTSLQSMFLKYIETLHYADASNLDHLEIIKQFQKIFKIIKESSLPIFDEADLLFNCRQETHFTLAAAAKIRNAHLDLSTLFYEIIAEDDFLKSFNFNFLEFNSSSIAYTKESFITMIKPYLAQKVIEKLTSYSDPRFFLDKMSDFIKTLNDEKKELLFQYFMGSASDAVNQFVSEIQDAEVANIITLSQAQLNIFLPLTLNKRILEHYGPPTLEGKSLAIPYHHGEPNSKSEFGNQYEVINYTIQYYLKQGISKEETKREVAFLKKEALEILRQFPSLKIEELKSFERLKKIYPQAKNFDLNEAEIQEATNNINNSNEMKLYMIRKFFLPEVKIYKYRISSNPQVFKHLFDTLLGFTGTMSTEGFPPGIETKNSPGIIGNTLSQIITKSNPKIKVIENEEMALNELDHLISDENTHAFIDLNGYFDFLPREKVCDKLLAIAHRKGLEGVAFYDDQGQLVIKTNLNKNPILLFKSELKNYPEKRFTFYDHQRTTGADVSQALHARAVLSVGKHLTLRDLSQAAWRMRGLEKGQAIDFVVSQEDQQVMLLELGHPGKKELSIEDIIAYSIHNQLKIKADDNLLSQKQKIHAIFERHALDLLFNDQLDPSDIIKFFSDFESLFIKEVVDEPRLQYQQAEKLIKTEKFLEDYISTLKSQYRLFFSPQKWGEIEREIKEIVDLSSLPTYVFKKDHSLSADLEQEIQVKTEVEVETKKETETKKEIQSFDPTCRVTKVKWSDALFRWSFSPIDPASFLPKLDEKYRNLSDSIFNLSGLSIVNMNPYLEEKFAFFSPKIAATSNLYQGLTSLFFYLPFSSQMSKLYSTCQNPCQEVMIIKEEEGIRLLMLDVHEAAEWKEYIYSNDQKEVLTTSSTIFLANLETGEIERPQSKSFQDEIERLQNSDEYKNLMLQAKLLSGYIFLSYEELNRLENWIDEKQLSKKALKDLMTRYVLAHRPTTLANYANSPLGKLLDESYRPYIKI